MIVFGFSFRCNYISKLVKKNLYSSIKLSKNVVQITIFSNVLAAPRLPVVWGHFTFALEVFPILRRLITNSVDCKLMKMSQSSCFTPMGQFLLLSTSLSNLSYSFRRLYFHTFQALLTFENTYSFNSASMSYVAYFIKLIIKQSYWVRIKNKIKNKHTHQNHRPDIIFNCTRHFAPISKWNWTVCPAKLP